MQGNPKVRLRLQLGSQFGPLAMVHSPFHAGLCRALEVALADRLDALGVPGVADVEIVADESQPMPVRWFVHGRECHYSDEIPVAAWSFARWALLGCRVDQGDEQAWISSIRSAALDDARTIEALTAFFGLFAKAVLEQRPSVLLGSEQTRAYAARINILEPGFPKDFVDLQARVAPVLSGVLDMGLSVADAPRLISILTEGRARRRALSDLEEDLITELTPETVQIRANLEMIKRISLGLADDEKRIPMMRELLFSELGIRYPRFRFVPSDELPDCAFEFKLNAWPAIPCMGVAPDELLVNETVEGLKLRGINASVAINPPTNGIRFSVINAADGPVARGAGLTTWNEHNYLILRLCTELRRRSSRFVSVRTVERALENLGATSPVLVARAKEKLGIEQITRVLRMLASEGVSVRNLRAILERLLEFDYVRCNPAGLMVFDDRIPTKRVPEKSWLQDPTTLVQFVRIGMRRRGEAALLLYPLDPKIEALLENYQDRGAEIPGADRDRVLAAIAREASGVPPSAQALALLTTIEVRSSLRKLIQTRFPDLPVLCYQELPLDWNIQLLARISL